MSSQIQDQRISLRVSRALVREVSKMRGVNQSDKFKRVLLAGLSNQSVDNADYANAIAGLVDLKRELAPIGANLNQVALYLNQGGEVSSIQNLDVLDELQVQFKQWIKVMKFIEKELISR